MKEAQSLTPQGHDDGSGDITAQRDIVELTKRKEYSGKEKDND